jgi:hypothetical protein
MFISLATEAHLIAIPQITVMQLRKCCNHPYLFEGVEDRTLDPLGEHLVENCGKLNMVLFSFLSHLFYMFVCLSDQSFYAHHIR